MARRIFILVLTVSAAFGGARMLSAEEPSMVRDLAATIALQGMPCDKVVDAKRNGDSDYTASCKDGNRYHVFVDSTGRVVVKSCDAVTRSDFVSRPAASRAAAEDLEYLRKYRSRDKPPVSPRR